MLTLTREGRPMDWEAADPVSQLINDFGPPVRSPALERQRAAMPFVHLERDLWELRDRSGDDIGPDAPERTRWLLDHGAVGQLRPEVTALLADSTTLAAAARLLLDQHFTPVLNEMICAAVNLDLAILEVPQISRASVRRPRAPASPSRSCAPTPTGAPCADSTAGSAAIPLP